MKKYIILFIAIMLIPFIVQAKETSTKLDFQYSETKTETKTQNMFFSFIGEFENTKNVTSIIKNEIAMTKIDDETDNSRQLSYFQINYKYNNNYVFFNTQMLNELALSIEDEFSYGAGIGRKLRYITGQVGAYNSTNSKSAILKLMINIKYPIEKINIIFNNSGSIQVNSPNQHRISSEVALEIPVSDGLNLKTGYAMNYNRVHESQITKRFYTGISYAF